MSDTVKVGCRLPQGIVLRVSEPGKNALGEPALQEVGTIEVAGSRRHVAAPGLVEGADAEVTFTDVPADLWAKWYEANKDGDLVTSGIVFKKGQDPLAKAEKTDDKAEAEKDAGAARRARPAATDGR